ncbi:hypothetical protein HEP_00508700, partial [Hepatocystis sp. ex Piliocolobus tephrosceles]
QKKNVTIPKALEYIAIIDNVLNYLNKLGDKSDTSLLIYKLVDEKNILNEYIKLKEKNYMKNKNFELENIPLYNILNTLKNTFESKSKSTLLLDNSKVINNNIKELRKEISETFIKSVSKTFYCYDLLRKNNKVNVLFKTIGNENGIINTTSYVNKHNFNTLSNNMPDENLKNDTQNDNECYFFFRLILEENMLQNKLNVSNDMGSNVNSKTGLGNFNVNGVGKNQEVNKNLEEKTILASQESVESEKIINDLHNNDVHENSTTSISNLELSKTDNMPVKKNEVNDSDVSDNKDILIMSTSYLDESETDKISHNNSFVQKLGEDENDEEYGLDKDFNTEVSGNDGDDGDDNDDDNDDDDNDNDNDNDDNDDDDDDNDDDDD